jgi:phosphatidylinositol-3-phosphatase
MPLLKGAIALALAPALAACAAPVAVGPSVTPAVTSAAAPSAGPPQPHVVVLILENKSYGQIADAAPFLREVMKRAAVFTNAHAVTHPSQPNYLALFSGSTQGVTDDHCPVRFAGKPNLARQLIDAGLTFTGYSEDLPHAGFQGCSAGGYAAKHNPWVDFDNVPATANQPFTAFPADFSALPAVSFVVPNLCHDMHDCSVAVGDTWVRDHLGAYLEWAGTHQSLLVITFDEDDGGAANQILTLIAGAAILPGTYREPINHYNVLRTIEELYHLPPLTAAGPITGIWR